MFGVTDCLIIVFALGLAFTNVLRMQKRIIIIFAMAVASKALPSPAVNPILVSTFLYLYGIAYRTTGVGVGLSPIRYAGWFQVAGIFLNLVGVSGFMYWLLPRTAGFIV